MAVVDLLSSLGGSGSLSDDVSRVLYSLVGIGWFASAILLYGLNRMGRASFLVMHLAFLFLVTIMIVTLIFLDSNLR